MKNEFKGTKGNWYIKSSIYIDDDLLLLNDENLQVATINNEFINDDITTAYNALLISKAPEMFEMLKRVLNDVDFSSSLWGNDAGLILSEEIEHLIESATKID